MALRLDPVRLLIADDVGIGKTIEACLVARELLDRGEIQRMAVLCPPHLAEQWQSELKDKFHIDTELVLASTARRLERNCGVNQSIFDIYPHVIVSMDYIKSDRRRDEFRRRALLVRADAPADLTLLRARRRHADRPRRQRLPERDRGGDPRGRRARAAVRDRRRPARHVAGARGARRARR